MLMGTHVLSALLSRSWVVEETGAQELSPGSPSPVKSEEGSLRSPGSQLPSL